MKIETVGIITKPGAPEVAQVAARLTDWFSERNIMVLLEAETARQSGRIDSGVNDEEFGSRPDLAVVVGGDGTLLAGARLLAGREIPILAINYGGLGFLTAVTIQELYTDLERVLAGEFISDRRMMIEVTQMRSGAAIASHRALNDVVINKGTPAHMIEVEVRVDDEYMSTFRADGLIVATPTGSTAYNLSAGGPIVHPKLSAVLMTPICSHTLTNRPIVLPEEVRIVVTFNSQGEEGVYATVDGQVGLLLEGGDQLEVWAARERVQLIAPLGKSYFDVLRGKLKWG
jgi:NAD+ kinase